MTKLGFFFALLISVAGMAQSGVNQRNASGERHGEWKKYYPNSSQLRYQGTFKNGKEVGTFKFYCESCDDQPVATKTYEEGSPLAHVQYFTKSGQLVSEGKMDGKKRVGEWKYYHKGSDAIMTLEHYKDGLLDGEKITYYTNGTPTEKLNYKEGKKHGKNKFYTPEGVLIKELLYENDLLQGKATYYNSDGKVIIKGQYKNNKKDGLWRYYEEDTLKEEIRYPIEKSKKKEQ